MTNLSSEDCWDATEADGTAAATEADETAAACNGATAALGPLADSRLDTITAPIRQVRASNFSSLRLCETGVGEAAADGEEAHELDGAATATDAACVDLRAGEASGLDNITAPICHVRVATLSPDCCC